MSYTYEPQGLAHPTTSNRHLRFRWQAWTGLCAEVNALGWPVQTAVLLAPALEVFQYLHNSVGIRALYSYEETGLAHTFDRDKEIARWARDNGIDWQEHRQQAVHRGLKHRKQWANDWHKTMHSPVTLARRVLNWNDSMCRLAGAWRCADAQASPTAWIPAVTVLPKGGEREAHRYLKTFFEGRVKGYRRQIGRPLESRKSCSRLSPYLAWGCLSMRQVYQAYRGGCRGPKWTSRRLAAVALAGHFIQSLSPSAESSSKV